MIEEIKAKIGQSTIVKDVGEMRLVPTPIMSIDIETFGENKKPGDCPYYNNHGIAGIALSNMMGDSFYTIVNDGKNYGGIPIDAAIAAFNRILATPGVKIVLIHYSKFDLGFLLRRGLKISHLRVVDTWMLRNLKSQGNYTAMKLKEIMRKKFNIATDTEKLKDEWMEKNGTEDYGDVPLEIMALYACDDPRYSFLSYLSEGNVGAEDWGNHDLYIRNNFHLIGAEERGIKINLDLMRQRLSITNKAVEEYQRKFTDQLGSAAIDINDEQAVLRFLHEKNLHAAPREQYGETKQVFDEEFLMACDHPLSQSYLWFHRYMAFRTCFSGNQGEMNSRIFLSPENEAGFHLQHLSSIFSKGGLVQLRMPDVSERVKLTNEIRELFVPRNGFKFVHIRAVDLQTLLLGFYTQNIELMAAVRTGQALQWIAGRHKLDDKVASLVLRQQLEGSGAERLRHRLTAAEVKGFANKNAVYPLQDNFVKNMPGLAATKERLLGSLKDTGTVSDRLGRVLRIEEKSRYRAFAVLVQSSYGSILSMYLDLFCRTARETGAHLVLAHEKEFLFETPVDNDKFTQGAIEISRQRVIDPIPVWSIRELKDKWDNDRLDAQEVGLGRL
jgi:3'-5' exonuclease